MTAAVTITQMTFRQLLGIKRLVGFGLLALFPAFIFMISSGNQGGNALLESFIGIGVGLFYFVAVPVVTLILSASALGDERRDQTLSYIVLRPIRRGIIAASKLAAAVLAAYVFTGTGALAMGIAYGLRSSDWNYVVPMLVSAGVATIVYAAVFVPLGYLSERSTLIGLAYVFIWEGAIVSAIGSLANTSPWRIGFTAFLALAPEEAQFVEADLGIVDPNLGSTIITVAVFIALSLAVTSWILRNRDLV